MNPIQITTPTLRETKRLFGRLKHLRCKLPVLRHLLLTAGPDGITLAATDLDHWLETRISDAPVEPQRFLIPPEALEAACRADRRSTVTITAAGGSRSRELRLALQSGGIEATSVYPTLDPSEFPERPETIGLVTEVPPSTMEGLSHVIGSASLDTTRQILNGVMFTPEDGGRLVATDGKRLACCPAAVPPQDFVLPVAACHILGHPDFTADLANITWIDHKEPEKRHVAQKTEDRFAPRQKTEDRRREPMKKRVTVAGASCSRPSWGHLVPISPRRPSPLLSSSLVSCVFLPQRRTQPRHLPPPHRPLRRDHAHAREHPSRDQPRTRGQQTARARTSSRLKQDAYNIPGVPHRNSGANVDFFSVADRGPLHISLTAHLILGNA